MIVIVDGYNVLKYQHGAYNVTEYEITTFLAMVRSRARYGKYHVTVVFDGGSSSYPSRTRDSACDIVYAGAGAIADDMIYEMSKKHQGQECVIVSADRRLCASVMQYGSYCVAPADYLHILYTHKHHVEASRMAVTPKMHSTIPDNINIDDLDALMEAASQHVAPKAIDLQQPLQVRSKAGQNKVAKQVQQLQRIMDKL